jgi:hypothetical protein
MASTRQKGLSFSAALLLICSLLVTSPIAANAMPDGPVNCGVSGTFTVQNDIVVDASACVGAVTIPSDVTAIANNAFRNQTGVTSVTFASGSQTASIGSGAFFIDLGLSPGSLASITIPSSVTFIGNGAFQHTALESVTFEPNSQLTTIDSNAFRLVSRLQSIEIPSSVTTINVGAFSDMASLESVTFGAGIQLTFIPRDAFLNAVSLTSIEIPDSVVHIGISAFQAATALTSVTFGPNSLLYTIRGSAFYGASSLSSIVIPDRVAEIYGSAFENATALTTVTLGPNSALTSVGDNAFRGASSLTSLELPANGPEVGSYAFFGTGPSLFSSSHVSWQSPLQPNSNAPKVGDKVFASAFEKHLSDFGFGFAPEEYVYRITSQENVPTSSVDLQTNGVYHSLTKAEQNQWYEDIGFDPVSAPASNPYLFSWRAFMCVSDVNGAVTLSKPNSLSLSYASREEVPTGSSEVNHWMLFKNASEQLEQGVSPSTRTVTGVLYDAQTYSTLKGSDVQGLDPMQSPLSFGIAQVHSSCGAGKSLEGLEIVDAGGTTPIVSKDFVITPSLKLKRGGDFFTENAHGITIGVTGGGGPPPQFAGSYNAALWGLTTIANPTPVNAQPSTYAGPIANTFLPRLLEVNKAHTVRVFGQNLDQVKAMSHKNIDLSFTIVSSKEIEVRIPALSIGIKEIKFDAGTGGIVTHLNALEVRDTSVSQSPAPEVPVTAKPVRKSTIWGFVAGLARLDSNGTKNLTSTTKRLATAKEITCIGFTMGPTATPRDIQLSYNRASVICKRMAASIPGAKVIRIEGRQETKVGDRIRRVEIWWR